VIDDAPSSRPEAGGTLFAMLGALSISHLLHDTIQSLVPAIYPMLKASLDLSFAQIGLVTFALQVTASLLQPVVGLYTDRRPLRYSLVGGMTCSLAGLLVLAAARSLTMVLAAATLIGLGSAIFHPESSRAARLASGGRHGLAQSIFQVGGNFGSSLGPLVAAFIVVPNGQSSIAWSAVLALVAIGLVWRIGNWYPAYPAATYGRPHPRPAPARVTPRHVKQALAVLLALVFSKYLYLTSLTSFYTFYLMEKFGLTVQRAQLDLFVFLAAVAAGTIVGGPIGDRFGRKRVIWGSIVGVLPFTLLLPYAPLFWTRILTVIIGLILASAFSAIVVFAQELVPHRVGLVAGLFFGVAFGTAGLGAAALGSLADRAGIEAVYKVCAYLPLIGLLTAFLPELDKRKPARA
jgi:FSR family fosmidomycin resistance protein-like MFS transporter